MVEKVWIGTLSGRCTDGNEAHEKMLGVREMKIKITMRIFSIYRNQLCFYAIAMNASL